ncbi:MAG: M48 family metallopeptidase [Bdellovibrionaceae bacterium]|nr:M48 family metallopeptidase [Pseudobdellovibrionaceae bacterium]
MQSLFTASQFFNIFLIALVLHTLVELYLNFRQFRYVKKNSKTVPQYFQEEITLQEHTKAASYSIAKLKLSSVELLWGVAILLFWTKAGGLAILNQYFALSATSAWYLSVLMILSFVGLNIILSLPFSLFKTFSLEEKFGFNKTTLKTFCLDFFKQLFLLSLIGFPLIALILWLLQSMGTYAWVYTWLFWVSFMVLMQWAYPVILAPLFNTFTPLEDEKLKTVILNLLKRCGFNGGGVFLMDGSKRSSHGNAYLSGLGSKKRIVFFDTLLKQLNTSEIESVLAHELGHFHHKHIQKFLLRYVAISFVAFFILGQLLNAAWFHQGLGVEGTFIWNFLILFSLSLSVFTFWLAPFSNLSSRKNEFEADQFAKEKASASDLKTALLKLSKDNAATLTPDSWYATYHYSHPDIVTRINHL